jgi:hypothetical protein
MDESPLIRALKQLAWDLPSLVLYGTGLVASLVYLRRFPRPCLLTFLGTGILLTSSIASTIAAAYLVQVGFEQGRNHGVTGWLLPTIAMAGSLLRGAAIGLLVMAVFSTRSELQASITDEKADAHRQRVLRFGLASTSLVIYLISLCLPAVYVIAPAIDAYRVYRGGECLIELPLALMYPAWWANPAFAIGITLVFMGYTVPGGICGLVSLLFSLSYCLDVLRDFEYNNEPVRIGYWFWVGAMLALAISMFLPLVGRRARRST